MAQIKTLGDARSVALTHIPKDYGLIDEATKELPEGWYFIAQTLLYIKTGDMLHMAIGSGGFIVERDTGHVIEFGSAHSFDENLLAYRTASRVGLRFELYDLHITRVRDHKKTLTVLGQLQLKYVIPEEEYGTVWKISRSYTDEALRKALRSLPCTFTQQRFDWSCADFIERLTASGCDFELLEHRGPPDGVPSLVISG